MKNTDKWIWYAVYGTNLNEQRFSCYIKGGTPEGTSKADGGCRDKTPAADGGKITIPHPLYFSKNSKRWENRSVGFLDKKADPAVKTLGRKYRITRQQFEDVYKQENDISIEQAVDVDLEKAIENGFLQLPTGSWYAWTIFLGREKGIPIFTLTSVWDFVPQEVSAPSDHYLKHLIKGLRQAYAFSDGQILEYLIEKPGIASNLSKETLSDLIRES